MRILLIRHSIAMEREGWQDDDLLRPLTEKGEKVAKDFFKKLTKIYPSLDAVITSKAIRAFKTADILLKAYPTAQSETETLLNPGCSFDDFCTLLNKYREHEIVAFVGHEPDFSTITSRLIGADFISMRLKKPSIVEIELEGNCAGTLRNLISPKVLKRFSFH